MKTTKTFGLYCRKFVVGEDWAPTAVICWGIAFVYIATQKYIENCWYLTLCIVPLSLYVSIRRGKEQYASRPSERKLQRLPVPVRHYLMLILPMAIVTVMPPVLFCLFNQNVGLVNFILPIVVLDLALSLIICSVLWNVYQRYPLLASVIGAAASLVVVFKFQGHLQIDYIKSVDTIHKLYFVLIFYIAAVIVTLLAYLFKDGPALKTNP